MHRGTALPTTIMLVDLSLGDIWRFRLGQQCDTRFLVMIDSITAMQPVFTVEEFARCQSGVEKSKMISPSKCATPDLCTDPTGAGGSGLTDRDFSSILNLFLV